MSLINLNSASKRKAWQIFWGRHRGLQLCEFHQNHRTVVSIPLGESKGEENECVNTVTVGGGTSLTEVWVSQDVHRTNETVWHDIPVLSHRERTGRNHKHGSVRLEAFPGPCGGSSPGQGSPQGQMVTVTGHLFLWGTIWKWKVPVNLFKIGLFLAIIQCFYALMSQPASIPQLWPSFFLQSTLCRCPPVCHGDSCSLYLQE